MYEQPQVLESFEAAALLGTAVGDHESVSGSLHENNGIPFGLR